MIVKGNSSADRITRWELLINNLKLDAPQISLLADEAKALEDMLPQARIMVTQQEDLRSQARAVGDDLKKMLRAGDNLRARMGSVLKGKLGFTTAALAKYGFNPAPLVRRRKAKAQPPASDTPETSTPAAPEAHPAATGK